MNGGGAVSLRFQRSPLVPASRSVWVPWNRLLAVDPVVMAVDAGSADGGGVNQAEEEYEDWNDFHDMSVKVCVFIYCAIKLPSLFSPPLNAWWVWGSFRGFCGVVKDRFTTARNARTSQCLGKTRKKERVERGITSDGSLPPPKPQPP